MEKEILKEICSELKINDRIIVKFFNGTFARVYHQIRRNIFNNMTDN